MRRACWLLSAVSLALSLPGQEQLRVLGPQPATVRLGEVSRVQIEVHGKGADPRTPEVPVVDGLRVAVAGPSRQFFQSIVNGRIEERVTATWTLEIRPQREGAFTIPAFQMWTGSRNQQVPAIDLTVVKELRGAEFGYLRVDLEPRRVYVHEPIRVRVEFGVDEGLQLVQDVARNGARYIDCEVQAAWLSEMEGAEPLTGDEEQRGAPVVLNRRLQMAEYEPSLAKDGKTWRSFVFHKSFLPVRPGRVTLEAPLLRYHVQVGRQRTGLFGEPRGGGDENYYVYGEPLQLEVLPIPEQGRPTPYYGSVGRFTIGARVDRGTVKVGSSVKLVLTIAGQGNFEFLRAPELAALEERGLHLLGQTEERKQDQLTVTYDLTPLHERVREIPAIEWNYFDTTPGVESFQTVRTEPIPLDVQPLPAGEALLPLPDSDKKAVTPGVDDIFDLPALDGPPARRADITPGTAWAAVFGPWLVIGLVVLVRGFLRLRNRDPLGNRARGARRAFERALAAGAEPTAALADYLGARLGVPAAAVIGPDLGTRLSGAGVDDELARELVAAIEQGTAGRYGGTGAIDADRARQLVGRCERVSVRRPGAGALLLLSLSLALGAGLRAQQDDGLALYRNGDYAAAEQAFASALEKSPDRRLWYARGNCFFRLGDLPRARWAYECARLGMPRDAELLANLALVRRRLELAAEDESFGQAVAAVRDRFTAPELAWACGALMGVAAVLLGLFWRRSWARWLAAIALVHGGLLAVELLWLRPDRPPVAVALRPLQLTAEPRDGLPATARVEPGVLLTWRSGAATGEFARVEVAGRSGYCKAADVALVR